MSYALKGLLAAAVVGLLACVEAGPVDLPELIVESVEVAPADVVLTVGDTVRLTAYPKAADGTVLGSVEIEWSAGTPAIATVAGNGIWGVVRALAPGNGEIHASAGGRTGTITVTVEQEAVEPPPPPAPVSAVDVWPDTLELMVGQEGRLEAVLRSADGAVLEGRSVAWSTGDEEAARVDGTGLVTALAARAVVVWAESEGVRGEAVVVVRDTTSQPQEPAPVAMVVIEPGPRRFWVGQAWPFAARVLDEAGQPLEGRAVTWEAKDPRVVAVDSSGLVRALNGGATSVRAMSEGVAGTATVDVFAVPQDSMELIYYGTFSDTSDSKILTGIDTTWVDERGVTHPATFVIIHGELDMDWSGGGAGYVQRLYTETWVSNGFEARVVEYGEYVDEGALAVAYDLFTGMHVFTFTSATTDGRVYQGTYSLPGELRVDLPVGTLPPDAYYFHMQ